MSAGEETARLRRQLTVIEARLIAARHLRLTDRIRLLESELARLRARLAEPRAGAIDHPQEP